MAKAYDPPVTIRLQDLGDTVNRRAKTETGGDRSKLIRRALQFYFSGGKQKIEDTAGLVAELRTLRAEFHRVGNNLNQLAHYFNVHDDIEDTKALAQVHEELRRSFWETRILLEAVTDDIGKSG